jgi:hypothetical protein
MVDDDGKKKAGLAVDKLFNDPESVIGRWLFNFLGWSISLLAGIVQTVARGWVVAAYWNWFVVGVLTTITLTTFQAIMIAIMVRMITVPFVNDTVVREREKKVYEKVTGKKASPLTYGQRLSWQLFLIGMYVFVYYTGQFIHKFY